MYARNLGGREFTFDFASGLIDDNLLIVDRETDSVWSQLAGQAVSGQMEGTPLEAMPSLQTTWGFWRQQHPDTRVMVVEGRDGRPYQYQDFVPGERRSRGVEHDTSTVGLGLAIGGESWFYPLDELAKVETPIEATIGGKRVTVHYSAAGLTAWATDESDTTLVSVIAYRRGWGSFFPESNYFSAGRLP